MTASTLPAPAPAPAASGRPTSAVPAGTRPARASTEGPLQRLRARLARHREWRRSLRDERARQHAVASAPTAATARELAALSMRR
ncbi:hypothetical protein [Trujillonella humicola]|uniref:hypothetical protein n=1 Tax=Trujillonella humicola TaxID=3383699 RepID=UPI003905F2BC